MEAKALSDKVYLRLKDAINSHELPPGSPLPEVELAKTLQMSRTPVREALRRLHAEGLVTISPGRGAAVGSISVRELLDAYEIRELLEPRAAERAARQGVSRVKALRLIERLKKLKDEPRSPHELGERQAIDRELHGLIAEAAGNELASRILADMHARMMRATAYLGGGGRFAAARREHIEIMEALLEGDAGRAEESVRNHLQLAKARLLER